MRSNDRRIGPNASTDLDEVQRLRETVSHLSSEFRSLNREVAALRERPPSSVDTNPVTLNCGRPNPIVAARQADPPARVAGSITDEALDLFPSEHPGSSEATQSEAADMTLERSETSRVPLGLFKVRWEQFSDLLESRELALTDRLAMCALLLIGTSLLSLASPFVGSSRGSRPHELQAVQIGPGFLRQPPHVEALYGSVEALRLANRSASPVTTEPTSAMRPKVRSVFALIRATVARAALLGLMRVESISDPAPWEPVVEPAAERSGRSRPYKVSGMTIKFDGGRRWTVYVDAGSTGPYPVLRIAEKGVTLATVGYERDGATLTMHARLHASVRSVVGHPEAGVSG